MNNQKTYDLACIGNYTKDTIISPSGTTYVDGGAMNYAAHASARLGCRVAVVTRLSEEDRRVVDKFKAAGIDCYPTYTPASTLMELFYPTTNPDLRTLSVAATAGTITARQVAGLPAKAAVIGASFRGEIGPDVIPALKNAGMTVAADMQGYVRVLRGQALVYEAWPEMGATLTQVDILKADMVEAEALTGETEVLAAARAFAAFGPSEILLTHKGGLLVYAGGECHEARFYPERLDGRSGRGDTCLGAYTSLRLAKPPREAAIYAAALTTLKMEKLGPFTGTMEDVEALVRQKYR